MSGVRREASLCRSERPNEGCQEKVLRLSRNLLKSLRIAFATYLFSNVSRFVMVRSGCFKVCSNLMLVFFSYLLSSLHICVF